MNWDGRAGPDGKEEKVISTAGDWYGSRTLGKTVWNGVLDWARWAYGWEIVSDINTFLIIASIHSFSMFLVFRLGY